MPNNVSSIVYEDDFSDEDDDRYGVKAYLEEQRKLNDVVDVLESDEKSISQSKEDTPSGTVASKIVNEKVITKNDENKVYNAQVSNSVASDQGNLLNHFFIILFASFLKCVFSIYI
jgi:hypothetical protein